MDSETASSKLTMQFWDTLLFSGDRTRLIPFKGSGHIIRATGATCSRTSVGWGWQGEVATFCGFLQGFHVPRIIATRHYMAMGGRRIQRSAAHLFSRYRLDWKLGRNLPL